MKDEINAECGMRNDPNAKCEMRNVEHEMQNTKCKTRDAKWALEPAKRVGQSVAQGDRREPWDRGIPSKKSPKGPAEAWEDHEIRTTTLFSA